MGFLGGYGIFWDLLEYEIFCIYRFFGRDILELMGIFRFIEFIWNLCFCGIFSKIVREFFKWFAQGQSRQKVCTRLKDLSDWWGFTGFISFYLEFLDFLGFMRIFKTYEIFLRFMGFMRIFKDLWFMGFFGDLWEFFRIY